MLLLASLQTLDETALFIEALYWNFSKELECKNVLL